MGFEREEQKNENGAYRFGGVRTFPLLGLTGFALALLGGDLLPATGLIVVGGLMFLSYRHKLSASSAAGVTTEVSGLTIYVVGALVCRGYIWISCALVIVSLLLLELKSALESLTRKIPAVEISTLAKFLLLAVVILPIVPNQGFTQFDLNPFKVVVAVVAVCGVSYASYVLERLDQGRSGIFLTALLGGAYSSTVTTIVLSKRCREDKRPERSTPAVFSRRRASCTPAFSFCSRSSISRWRVRWPCPSQCSGLLLGVGAGWWWSTRGKAPPKGERAPVLPRNPLQLEAAVVFAMVLTAGAGAGLSWSPPHLGKSGTYAFAGVMGVSDVDPLSWDSRRPPGR